MKRELLTANGFAILDECEAVAVRGGVDKQAQDALYLIGYAIGVIAKAFVTFFVMFKKWLN